MRKGASCARDQRGVIAALTLGLVSSVVFRN